MCVVLILQRMIHENKEAKKIYNKNIKRNNLMLPQCVSSCSECYIRDFFYVFLFSFIWHKMKHTQKIINKKSCCLYKISSRFMELLFYFIFFINLKLGTFEVIFRL